MSTLLVRSTAFRLLLHAGSSVAMWREACAFRLVREKLARAEYPTVADAAELLGCNQTKVRQYVKWKMLDSFKVGHKIMIVTSSLRELIQINTEAQKRASNSDNV